ncbi:10 TM Acyl Transferase domain found in Cas1p [Fragilaria crotonensis]|nr:10 TM Acyl Transferase domain found in Cas1p [Fragilaria crotonensis]
MSERAPNGGISGIFSDFGNHSAANAASTTTLASAMLFGTIAFAAVSLAARSYLAGDTRALRAAHAPRSTPLDFTSFSSVYTLLHHLTIFGVILFYAYICEYHPPFPHSNKSYDRDEFLFLCTLLMVASAYTWKRNDPDEPLNPPRGQVVPSNDKTEILNRNQTEEWKGWMQFVFLLYHYYHAEETYNLVRILITCYVWMTGFGNFSFFYLTGDFGLVRVLQMLWRLNFLVVFLCMTQGTTYILYYICLLHTYYFLMVYATMRLFKEVNHTKWGIRIKLGVLAGIILFVWDFNTVLFRLIHFPFLGEKPILGADSGSMWEWYFRSSLDHWSTFLGMIFALNFPITSLFFRKLEAQSLAWEIMAKGAVGLALFGAFWVWLKGPFQQGKVEYNQTNAYFGFIPLITYIYFRNLTPWLRAHSMELLHQIGKTTLETYLMQHHIWLTSNAKSLLTLVPGWPKVNMLLVTLIYFIVARKLHHLTLYLRGIVLPDNSKRKCLINISIMFGIIFGYFALAFSLQSLGVLNLTTVGIVSIGAGSLLYKACMDLTWRGFKESAISNRAMTVEETVLEKMVGHGAGRPKYDTPINVISAPMVGVLVVFIVGLAWHGMAQVGGTSIGLLPEGCKSFVNQGAWIPVDSCNEESRGMGYRNHGISAYATCAAKSDTYVWGWKHADPSSHCRFTHRDAKALRKALSHRTITFVGDSITRHVYHATLRQMGMAGAGAYNTKVSKRSDFTHTVGDTTMEFEWAALATDQVVKLRDIIARPVTATAEKSSSRPDLVVMGGGAWDRLHVFATDEDRESHRATVKELAKEIRLARSSDIPVAWIVPTTINTNALLTEEKQLNIKEEDMAAMRALYNNLGVTEAASFVLDGPSFTEGRVDESYDGVHYPLAVYDAGAQILANAMDWIFPEREEPDPFKPPMPGSMAKPVLGIMMLCFVFMGLACFDGFMGFSYLAVFFVSDVMPSDLYKEAFDELHERMGLPDIDENATVDFSIGMTTISGTGQSSGQWNARSITSGKSGVSGTSNVSKKSAASEGSRSAATVRSDKSSGKESASSAGSIDEEIAALLGTTSRRLDLNELDDEA